MLHLRTKAILSWNNRRHYTSASTVFRGTCFENRCLHLLQSHLGMTLQRVGGKEDGGVDLNGWWWLPDVNEDAESPNSSFKRARVLAQCKAEKKKVAPKYVRELEGVVWRYMALENTEADVAAKDPTPIVAVFLSESPFTKSTILRAMSSQVPLLLVYVPPLPPNSPSDHEDTNSSPGSCIYNHALGGSTGLFKGEMEVRWCWYPPSLSSSEPVSGSNGAPALFYRGVQLRGWIPSELQDTDNP